MNEPIICDTPESIEAYRMLAMRSALKLEAKGLRMSRGRSVLSMVRKEFGVKARTASAALAEFEKILKEKGIT